jgi:hypothetical protein
MDTVCAAVLLILEIAGSLALAVTLQRVLKPTGVGLPGLIAISGIVVAVFAFASGVWPQARALMVAHTTNAELTRQESNFEAGKVTFAIDNGFLTFVDAHVPQTSRVYITCGTVPAACGSTEDWLGFRMTPRTVVGSPDAARWSVFYNTPVQPFAAHWRTFTFGPDELIAENPR